MKNNHEVRVATARIALCCSLGLSWILAVADAPAHAQAIGVVFETELLSLDLTGGPFPMPLASDPTNALGDSVSGFGFVDSQVTISLSSQRTVSPGPQSLGVAWEVETLGTVILNPDPPDPQGPVPNVDPNLRHGDTVEMKSFFDVVFDITVTDVDSRSGRDYAGQPDGASIQLQDLTPAEMETDVYTATFDKDAPSFGLLPPPEMSPYLGHFDIVIPLGGDINGNAIDDVLKFTLATHSVLELGRTFITLPDGTVVDSFDSGAYLAGAVQDETADPEFIIGDLLPTGLPDPTVFGGPTEASSKLVNPVVPEPSTVLLLIMGLAMGGALRISRTRK